ncbi:MAG TPA: HlyD family secretion protein [Cyanobacteria bacterium UBA8803]|nr:HlyD family secretion protein [Cyanobacteria bacterium UBA9273]HBL61987.1 HlyD family secretion protein [Cyanobacteria bacterium UBA8803]
MQLTNPESFSENANIQRQPNFQVVSLKPVAQRTVILAIIATLATGGILFYGTQRFQLTQNTASPIQTTVVPEITKVTALGRLEPEGEVIQLSAPASAEGNRVAQLLVKPGDKVQSGQVIAVLDSRDRLSAALEQAREQVRVAQARLAQVQAGAKTGEIQAQQATIARTQAEQQGEITAQTATIARLEAQLRNAETEYQRYQFLYQEGATSASTSDSKRLAIETLQQQLNEAKANLARIEQARQQQLKEAQANLNRIAEVRPVDVQAAQAEVNSAIAAVKRAQAELDLAYVRSPRKGQILEIHTWPGEALGNAGIADLGQTEQMYAVAEVYETDVEQVREGQRAVITSSAFKGELTGTVDRIGWQVQKKDVLNTDPIADIDARVVEVKIRLDAAATSKVAHLTNSQVKVEIQL